MERKFSPVADNYEKQQTYKKLLSKHKKAMDNGFYYEAILIEYALMEDRLRSCIYYLGLLADRNAIKISNNNAKKTIKQWMIQYFPDEKPYFRISSISGKRKIILTTLYWFQDAEAPNEKNKYVCTLYKIYHKRKANIDTAIQYLNQCQKWCEYRNEIIHCLFNKNSEEISEKLKQIAEEGIKIARYFDRISDWLKQNYEIRNCLKLKTE